MLTGTDNIITFNAIYSNKFNKVKMHQSNRIQLLDSFRFLAILFVVLFHFFSSWTQPEFNGNYYPYGDILSKYFKYGFFGVQFFFIISGFVIFFTLEKSKSFGEFISKRFIRLLPAMIICSILTYLIVPVLDPKNIFSVFHSKSILDFIPSLTFTTPSIWNWMLGTENIDYVCGVYWSLWVEMTFYVFSSVIFFLNKDKFLIHWAYFTILATLLRIAQSPDFFLNNDIIKEIYSVINFLRYVTYFTLGIIFYSLYSKKKIPLLLYFISILLTLLEMIKFNSIPLNLLLVSVIILFILFIYKPERLSFLDKKIFYNIGISSYVLYLIHEYIGIILIFKISSIGMFSIYWFLPPIIVILGVIFLSIVITDKIENPISKFIKNILFN